MDIRAAVVDLDGTVLSGDELIPGAAEALERIRESVEHVLFLTNNPTRPPEAYAEKLQDLGVLARPEEVITSCVATIDYLDAEHAGETVFPVAEESIVSQLRDAGVPLTDDATEADVVVAGYDREFHYHDMIAALRAFEHDGGEDVAFVGTDPDRTVPAPNGPVPGSGAIIRAVAGVADREPDAILGKPSQETVDLAAERLGVPAEECVLVGDRLDTDVAMGEKAGMTTILVRTGVTDERELAESEFTPNHVVDDLAAVPDLLDEFARNE
ncbi:HAD-IIA family hydrolase [Halospeciosus flavus]|uniref:HAD-IIA family hydrolase n=1 Tax=Halospeciosus flavus TaxID=3032283 RepID=A0ABD5Z3W1_9EURY|nr:HAD-IIA family hydrolase [Halospeciosus flavus]